MRDWASIRIPVDRHRYCDWCAVELRGTLAIAWHPNGRQMVGCWRCVFIRAAHLLDFQPNPQHRFCSRQAA